MELNNILDIAMADLENTSSGAEVPSDTPPVISESPPPSDAGGAEPKKTSLREELQKNFNELREPRELRKSGKPEPVSGKATDGPKVSEEDRPRGPDGKFLPKDEKAVEAKKSAPAEIAPKTDVSPAPASAPPGLPPGWSPETKAFVSALPPDHPLRKDVEKRETEISNGFKKYSDDAKKYSEIEQVLAPVRQTFQQAGVQSDAEAIRRLFMWEQAIRANPTDALPRLARQYGLDLASLAQSSGSNQTPPDASQQIQQLVQNAIQPVQSEIQRIQADRASSEIAAFSKDKPHFEKVKTQMGQLMARGAATDLDGAYQMAIWNDPEIRAQLIQKEADEKVAAHQKAQQEQVQRSKNARKAAISPSGNAPAAPALNGKEKAKGVRGSILESINQLREERA